MDLANAYRKQTHREHILSLPDTYIGSIETAPESVWLRDGEGNFAFETIPVNPGFYKLVDELLVNAHDHVIRLRQRNSETPVKHIAFTCDGKTVSIENDGDPIDVAEHPEHKVWIPQLIFGELLTSTNYDKNEKKLVGGKNGYGVKLVNIFAKQLDISIVDAGRKLQYNQTFRDNMTVIDKPKVKASKGKSHVKLEWTPDYGRFGFESETIPTSMVKLIERRVWDLAMTVGKEVKVTWNGELVKCRTLQDYAKAYNCEPVLFESPNDRWQIAVAPTPSDGFMQVSFVNGIWTRLGGKHVDAVTDQIVGHVVEYLETKKKTKVKPGLVREHLAVFIVSLIENPSFSSQTKETLTTKASAFGSSPKLSDEFLKKVVSRLGVVESILEAQAAKDAKDNTKTDGRKQSRITGIPKLDDAVYAGTTQSNKCTLILTEGDSAKAMALSGLTQEQRKYFGVYPLKGKVLNVKDTSDSKVEQTKEIAELKKIIGLQSGKKYTDTSGLRYGSVLIMTDQDYDGSHIRGLLINLFHELWHELIAIPGFLTYMATPIVKATKGKTVRCFYSQYEYEQWRETPEAHGYKVKYYKGLGTSTRDEAKEYFQHLSAVKFDFTPGSDEAIDMAFNKKRADDRKEWLQGYDKSALIPPGDRLPYPDFINKDLIHFSNYNLERSIPCVMDGLKTSQRKILYAAFKRNLTAEIRVAQFAGYVSEHTGYHHGEASLNETIIGMAQDFMGANNIAWFVPQGQFGTRLQGGKDSASPRYIHTYLQPVVRKLVPEADFPVLTYRDDDGLPVEPEWYAPVLPMLLVNGARGIGTGYSTYVPPHNPVELKRLLVDWLNGNEGALDTPLKPFFRGFRGTVADDGTVEGVYRKDKEDYVITELPPGTWTADYREWLEKEMADGRIKDFVDVSTDTEVNIRIKGIEEAHLKKSLTDKVKVTNMHAFNSRGVITKYESANEILKEFAHVRLGLYEKRRVQQIADLMSLLPYHMNVMRFIEDQISDKPKVDLRRKTNDECAGILGGAGYTKIDDKFEYLMRLPVSTFTAESIRKNQQKLDELRTEIQRLERCSPAEMWLTELSGV
jgi:DNA topoisomerase II